MHLMRRVKNPIINLKRRLDPDIYPRCNILHMDIIKTANDLKTIRGDLNAAGKTLALVPTMGALHEGHMALVRRAKDLADCVMVSIFVNPAQFGPNEDLERYPRTLETDCQHLDIEGVDYVYAPTVSEIYPDGPYKKPLNLKAAQGLESDFRPGFFDGVTTVVSILFDQTRPDIAVFGEKDYQQICVVREMVGHLDMPVQIIGVPVVRADDGLALSSRNAYLSQEDRNIALALSETLGRLADIVKGDPDMVKVHIDQAKDDLLKAGFNKVDYIELRDPITLAPIDRFEGRGRFLAAAHINGVRLIDTVEV